MNFRHFCIPAIVLTCVCAPQAKAQSLDGKIDEYFRKVSGKGHDKLSPELITPAVELPGDSLRWSGPGMIYVEGLIAPDGATAIRLFRYVADSLGADHWKEDALARMSEQYAGRNTQGDAGEAAGTLRHGLQTASYRAGPPGEAVLTVPDTAVRPDSTGRIVAVYAIQVGAFSVADNAEKLAYLLSSKGFKPIIYDNLIDGKRLLHLVWVGRYDRPEDAQPELKKIEELTGVRGVLREQMIWRHR